MDDTGGKGTRSSKFANLSCSLRRPDPTPAPRGAAIREILLTRSASFCHASYALMYNYYSSVKKGQEGSGVDQAQPTTPYETSAIMPPPQGAATTSRSSLPPFLPASQRGGISAPADEAKRSSAPPPPYYGRQSVVQQHAPSAWHGSTDPSYGSAAAVDSSSSPWQGRDEQSTVDNGSATTYYSSVASSSQSGGGGVHQARRRHPPIPGGGGLASEEAAGLLASSYRGPWIEPSPSGTRSAATATSDVSSGSIITACLALCVVAFLVHNPYGVNPILISFLALYGIDLANLPKGWLVTAACWCVLLGCLFATVANSAAFGRPDTAPNSGWAAIPILLSFGLSCLLFVSVLLHATTALVGTGSSSARWSRSIRLLLSGLVPLLTAEAATSAVFDASSELVEAFPLAVPFTFAAVLTATSWMCRGDNNADIETRGAPPDSSDDGGADKTTRHHRRPADRVHELLIRYAPLALHVATCWGRMVHQFAGADDVYELAAAWAVPNLLAELVFVARNVPRQSSLLGSVSTLRRAGLALVAFFSLQQRYVLAMTHSFSYRFMGEPPTVVASTLYGLAAILCTLMSSYLWVGSSSPDGFLASRLGEYQEDAIQLGLALAGLFLGRMFGLPWNFTPLPILAFLGLTLWIATRMLRYLVIFLFVLHATGMVIFTYRFAGMTDIRINLVGLGSVTLMRFGFIAVMSSVLVGLLAGLAIRSSGGYGYNLIKRLHGVGILMTLYSLLLMVLEITLLRRPVPSNELSGVEFDADEIQDASTLYRHWYGIVSGCALIALATFAQRVRIVAPSESLVVIAVNLGKAVCLWMDSVSPSTTDESGWKLFVRALVSAGMIWVMFAPQVLLEPLHSKIKRRRSSLTVTEIPIEARRKVYSYMGFVLPSTLLCAIPMVLSPLASLLSDAYQNGFYLTSSFASRSLPIVELLASTVALWGLSSLSMLNHYLPEESSGQALKKLTAFSFLIGSLLFLVSPLLGSGISAKALSQNPYAAMSLLGSQLIRGKQRSGAWGLLAASLATLLALSGPLELRERRIVSATTGHASKDRRLLLRTMIFGLLFGGGVAWFVVLQCLQDVELGALLFLGMSSLSVACMGTVAAVLGYFMDLEAFGDAEQVIQFTMMLAAALLPVSGISVLFMANPRHYFGSDGWLSTYLTVVSITFFATALCLRNRPTKNARTCAMANALVLAAWASAMVVLFGRYGISGLDANYEVRSVFGIPASAIGTLLFSPMLLVLEGDVSARRRSTTGRLSAGRISGGGSSVSSIGVPLVHLGPSNRFFPLFFGSVSVFLVASMYGVLLRGSGLLNFLGGPVVAMNSPSVISSPLPSDGEHLDLASLARLAASHSNVLLASAQLTGCGFFTSQSWTGPILHLSGVLCCVPTLNLNAQQSWYRKTVPLASVLLALPLLAVPLLLCRGIVLLRLAALLCLVAGSLQAWLIRKIRHESNMRI